MFDKSTWIRLPRNVVVGHGVLDQTVEAVSELHLQGRPLVVTSPTPREVAAERVAADFEAAGDDPAIVEIESASFESVQRVSEVAREVDAGYLVGVGGGKAIDIAKMASD